MNDIDTSPISEVRAQRPESIRRAAVARRRGPRIASDGRLLLVAADHPARGALGVRDVRVKVVPQNARYLEIAVVESSAFSGPLTSPLLQRQCVSLWEPL